MIVKALGWQDTVATNARDGRPVWQSEHGTPRGVVAGWCSQWKAMFWGSVVCDGHRVQFHDWSGTTADEELHRWHHKCPVRWKLNPSAENSPHPREVPEFVDLSSDLMALHRQWYMNTNKTYAYNDVLVKWDKCIDWAATVNKHQPTPPSCWRHTPHTHTHTHTQHTHIHTHTHTHTHKHSNTDTLCIHSKYLQT